MIVTLGEWVWVCTEQNVSSSAHASDKYTTSIFRHFAYMPLRVSPTLHLARPSNPIIPPLTLTFQRKNQPYAYSNISDIWTFCRANVHTLAGSPKLESDSNLCILYEVDFAQIAADYPVSFMFG